MEKISRSGFLKLAAAAAMSGVTAGALTACNNSASSSTAAASGAAVYTPGTYTAKATGMGEVTVSMTFTENAITDVTVDTANETIDLARNSAEDFQKALLDAQSAEIDGVSGATYTTNGCKAAVLNALDPEANPYEENAESTTEWPTGAEPVEIPAGSNIVMASTYGLYTKSPDSAQDAVIKATLYWDEDTDTCYAIRFKEALTPWEDTGSTSGWACVEDADVLAKLGDAVIPFSAPATEYSEAVETNYAKYIQIGDIVWTGTEGSTANCEHAIVYSAVIDGTETTLFDYCATEEGGQWYLDATDGKDCYLLTSDEAASSDDAANVAATYSMQYKEGDGHGTAFWSSPITFPGNMQLLKEFAEQTNFSYDYYADGGLTQNADGYWQTADAVSGATIAEGCTYLDMLKTLYDRIQNGEYEKAV